MRGMGRLLSLMIGLTMLLAVVIGLACLIGLTFPADRTSALNVPADCSQPCWHGIRPHVTSVQEGLDLIKADPALRLTEVDTVHFCWAMPVSAFAEGCAYSFRNAGERTEVVEIVSLVPRPNSFLLGDAIAFFGKPIIAVYPCQQVNGHVYFDASTFVTTSPTSRLFSPTTAITELSFVGRQNLWYDARAPRWVGFGWPSGAAACPARP